MKIGIKNAHVKSQCCIERIIVLLFGGYFYSIIIVMHFVIYFSSFIHTFFLCAIRSQTKVHRNQQFEMLQFYTNKIFIYVKELSKVDKSTRLQMIPIAKSIYGRHLNIKAICRQCQLWFMCLIFFNLHNDRVALV